MPSQTIKLIGLICLIAIASCELQDPMDPDNGDDTEPSSPIFVNVSSSNIPAEIQQNNAKAATAADLDTDGDMDIVLATEFSTNRVLMNNGSGSFSNQTPLAFFGKRLDSEDVVVTDFSGDGSPDLFFANGENKTNELYLNRGQGTYIDVSNRIPVTGVSLSAAVSDLYSDGDQDLLIGNDGQNSVLVNNGEGFFTSTPERLPNLQGITYDLATSDINKDGLTDIVVANDINNQIYINGGPGFFENQTSSRLPLIGDIEETRDVEVTDLNGDGAPDIFFANAAFEPGADAQNRLLINNGSGVFGDSTSSGLPELHLNTVAAEIADLNMDGAPDIVTGSIDSGLRVLINDGNGNFILKTDSWIPDQLVPQVQDVIIAQLNSDNRPDLYVCTRQDNSDLLLIQNSQQ